MNSYEALTHAVKAHGATLDKCGQLYVLHPIAVAEAVETCGIYLLFDDAEALVPVALLHDVLEDTDYALPHEWFTPAQWDALYLVTQQPGDTYAEYIASICANPAAIIVKLADLWHNLQLERQRCLPESEQRSLEKRYLKARQTLWDALGQEWWPE